MSGTNYQHGLSAHTRRHWEGKFMYVCVCMNQTELFTEQTLSQHRNADEHTNSCSFSVRTSPPLGHADRWDGKCVTGSTSRLLRAAILEQMGGFQFSCICGEVMTNGIWWSVFNRDQHLPSRAIAIDVERIHWLEFEPTFRVMRAKSTRHIRILSEEAKL